ncbi:MAG: phage replication initiation protein, NGO0469 family [Nitrosopumilaceae archaeon]
MSLNLNDAPANSNKSIDRALPKAGSQPARIAQVIDLGVQPRPAFKGKEKSPVHQVFINFELVNDEYEFEGKKIKHRIGPKPFNVVSKSSEMYDNSAIAKFLKAIDPNDSIKGSLPELLDKPCLATIVHNEGMGKYAGRKFANLTQVMLAPEGFPIGGLSTPAVVFSFDNPTEDAWKAMPDFLKNKIKTALNYRGSKVEALVNQLAA